MALAALPFDALSNVIEFSGSLCDVGRVAICCRWGRDVALCVAAGLEHLSWTAPKERVDYIVPWIRDDLVRVAAVSACLKLRHDRFESHHVHMMAGMLKDGNTAVQCAALHVLSRATRSAALQRLARLDDALAQHAADVVAVLVYPADHRHRELLPVLDQDSDEDSEGEFIDGDSIEGNDDDDPYDHPTIQFVALNLLFGLGAATIAEHADAVVRVLEEGLHDDSDLESDEDSEEGGCAEQQTCILAVEALAMLEPAALAQYAETLVAKLLKEGDHIVRKALVTTLGRLEPSAFAGALVAKLEDASVREAALDILGRLEPQTLAEHAAAVIAWDEDIASRVREATLHMVGRTHPSKRRAEHALAAAALLENRVLRIIKTAPAGALDEADDAACQVCGSGDDAATMLLCDGCETGAAHTSCLGLSKVPDGDWFCPACGGAPYGALDEADDVACQVCGSGDDDATLLLCDGCDAGAVHTSCVGLSEVPDDDWFCPACGGMSYVDLVCRPKPKAMVL